MGRITAAAASVCACSLFQTIAFFLHVCRDACRCGHVCSGNFAGAVLDRNVCHTQASLCLAQTCSGEFNLRTAVYKSALHAHHQHLSVSSSLHLITRAYLPLAKQHNTGSLYCKPFALQASSSNRNSCTKLQHACI